MLSSSACRQRTPRTSERDGTRRMVTRNALSRSRRWRRNHWKSAHGQAGTVALKDSRAVARRVSRPLESQIVLLRDEMRSEFCDARGRRARQQVIKTLRRVGATDA